MLQRQTPRTVREEEEKKVTKPQTTFQPAKQTTNTPNQTKPDKQEISPTHKQISTSTMPLPNHIDLTILNKQTLESYRSKQRYIRSWLQYWKKQHKVTKFFSTVFNSHFLHKIFLFFSYFFLILPQNKIFLETTQI